MRSIRLALVMSAFMLPMGLSAPAPAQGLRIGPGGVEVVPPRAVVRDELRDRMLVLRGECEAGDRRACVRLGMILGENRERHGEWRREHPEVFFFER